MENYFDKIVKAYIESRVKEELDKQYSELAKAYEEGFISSKYKDGVYAFLKMMNKI